MFILQGSDDKSQEELQINNKHELKRRYASLSIGLLLTLAAIVVATFAWYIFNTATKTTEVHMAAGTSTKLEIAPEYKGPYSSSIEPGTFTGVLDPVSTNRVTDGFWIVTGMEKDDEGNLIARYFNKISGMNLEYYKTTMYIRTNAINQGIYACNLEYDKTGDAALLATAMRVAFVVHKPGENQPVANEYIFSISDEQNPERKYNTYTGKDGYVLNSKGEVVEFNEYKPKNFVKFDKTTGVVTKTSDSVKLFDLSGTGDGKPSDSVQVDVYIWLEGCDADCTNFLGSGVMQDIAIIFVSYPNE